MPDSPIFQSVRCPGKLRFLAVRLKGPRCRNDEAYAPIAQLPIGVPGASKRTDNDLFKSPPFDPLSRGNFPVAER